MQTILGSNGQIGYELANELYQNYTKELRLVGRHPQKIHDIDQVVVADLTDADQAFRAIQGSDVVYFTVGLPMDTPVWEAQFLQITENVIQAALKQMPSWHSLITLTCIKKMPHHRQKRVHSYRLVVNRSLGRKWQPGF